MPLTLQKLHNKTKFTVRVTNLEHPDQRMTIGPKSSGHPSQGLAYQEAKGVALDLIIGKKALRVLTMWDRDDPWGMFYRIGSAKKDARALKAVDADYSKDFAINVLDDKLDLFTYDGNYWHDKIDKVTVTNWLEATLHQRDLYISDGKERFLSVEDHLDDDPDAYVVTGKPSLSSSIATFRFINDGFLAKDPFVSLYSTKAGRHISRGKTKVHLASYSSELVEVEQLVIAHKSENPSTQFLINFLLDGSLNFRLGHPHKRKGDHTDHAYVFADSRFRYIFPESEGMAESLEKQDWGGDIYQFHV